RRVIGVVFGGSTGHARDAHMVTLLDDGFRTLTRSPPKPIEEKEEPELLDASAALALLASTDDALDFAPTVPVAPIAAAPRPAPRGGRAANKLPSARPAGPGEAPGATRRS